jgi:DNA-binding transcriptional LysR family regulator
VSDQLRTAPATPLDWDDARVFLALADAGSLSGAARRLGVNHATIARRLARLEAAAGVRSLFENNADGYVLTPAGALALPQARAMEAAAARFIMSAGSSDEISGAVTISALASFAELRLAPLLADLVHTRPGLQLHIVGENRAVGVSRGEADLAVRHGRTKDTCDLARRLGDIDYRLYAAQTYLDQTPPPERRLIGFTPAVASISPIAVRLQELTGGRPFAMTFSSLAGQAAAAAAGAGMALLPTFLAASRPDLTPVEDRGPADWSQQTWLVLRADVRRVARVRFVADLLAASLSG